MRKTTTDLIKIYLKQTFSSFGNSKKASPLWKNALFFICLMIFVAAALGSSFYGIAQQFASAGMVEMVLVVGLIFSAFMTLMFTVFEQQAVFFRAKDFEMLSPLPIKPVQIVVAKFASSYLSCLFFSTASSLPVFVVYFCFAPISIVPIIYCIISLFLLPSFIMLIGNALGFLISLLTAKMKNKNMVTTIFSLVLTIGLVVFISLSSSGSLTSLFTSGEIPLWIKIVLPYIWPLFESITAGTFLFFLMFLGICFVCLALSVTLSTFAFNRSSLSDKSSSSKKISITYKSRPVFSTLLKKEFKTFFNMPIYCTNCFMGAIMTIVLALILSLTTQDVPSELAPMFAVIFSMCAICCFGSALPTYVTFNVDGPNIETTKSLPISFEKIALSKIIFSVVLYLPFIVIANILFFSISGGEILTIIFSLLTQISALVAMVTVGLYINLKYPKVNWTTETQAVKQSISVFYGVMVAFALSLLPFAIVMIFPQILSILAPWIFMLIHIGITLVLFATFSILLKKQGNSLYLKL